MTSAEERIPDREGYLRFTAEIEGGNKALEKRAIEVSWWERPLQTELGFYQDLRDTEKFLANYHFAAKENQKTLQAYSAGLLRRIKDPVRREKVTKNIDRLFKAWTRQKEKLLASHTELHRVDNYKADTSNRLNSHPQESESQAWFKAKWEWENVLAKDLNKAKEKFTVAVQKRIIKAIGPERSREVAELTRARLLCDEYERTRSTQPQKDRGRDR
jgi:hypothetical protein